MAKRLLVGEREKEILKFLLHGTMLATMFVVPNMGKVFESFLDNSPKRKFDHKKRFENLEQKGLIFLSGDKVKLSAKGRKLASKTSCEDVVIEKPKKWDGIWQIVSYDIPVENNQERDYFRQKLEDWGFKKIQKSIWILPYECREEIAVLAKSLGINRYVLYFNTTHIPNEKKYLELFGLEGEYRKSK